MCFRNRFATKSHNMRFLYLVFTLRLFFDIHRGKSECSRVGTVFVMWLWLQSSGGVALALEDFHDEVVFPPYDNQEI